MKLMHYTFMCKNFRLRGIKWLMQVNPDINYLIEANQTQVYGVYFNESCYIYLNTFISMILYLLNKNCSGPLYINNSSTFSYRIFNCARAHCFFHSECWCWNYCLIAQRGCLSVEVNDSAQKVLESSQDLFLAHEASITSHQYVIWFRALTRS